MHYYDINGWYTAVVIPGRDTEVAPPPNIQAGYAANWTGHEWLVVLYASPPAPPIPTQLTHLEFLNRFTTPERLAIRTAAKTNVAMEDYLALVDAAEFIDLTFSDTGAGVRALEVAGLLQAGRADEILGLA